MSDEVIPADPAFKLDRNDLDSQVWKKLKRHLQARRESLRNRLENDHDELKTAKLRGSVAVLKELLALDTPAPELGADEGSGE